MTPFLLRTSIWAVIGKMVVLAVADLPIALALYLFLPMALAIRVALDGIAGAIEKLWRDEE